MSDHRVFLIIMAISVCYIPQSHVRAKWNLKGYITGTQKIKSDLFANKSNKKTQTNVNKGEVSCKDLFNLNSSLKIQARKKVI